VVDENGNDLPHDGKSSGEVLFRGPWVTTSYYKAPHTRSNFTEDGFFKTGDLARIDDLGNVTITGRIKDIILRGGENINTAEIEKLIIGHPMVENVAVIGMPDKELGERICAYIRLAPKSALGFDGIISFLKDKGASVLQLPERIEFVDEIPLTKVGKADKKALVEDIKKRLGTHE